MGWKLLNDERRTDLLKRYKSGEDVAVLAGEVGMKSETLSRQLRRFAHTAGAGMSTRIVTRPTTDRVQINEVGNTLELESEGGRIRTLEDLLAACEVDQNEWIVDHHIINKWDVGRKATTKNLYFEDGVISGSEYDSGGINVEPLFQVKVWLTKRNPEPIQPAIKPVYINTLTGRPAERVRGMKSALIIPDTQFGFSRDVYRGTLTEFHDRRALDVVTQIAEVVEPDTAVFLGDVNDFSGWSDKFIKRPEFYFTTQPALIEAAWYMGQIRKRVSGEVFDLEGNHDIRPETQIINHLMEAYQLRSADNLDASPVMGIDNLLGLSRMGITYVGDYPNGDVWINEFLRCIHGNKVKAGPGQTASAVVKDSLESVIFGHIHKREMASKTILGHDGYRVVTAFSPGCLCHIDGRVPGSTKYNNWQQGAAMIWYDETTSNIVPIDIFNGRAVYNGVLYQGRDYTADLRRDTGWGF